MNRTFAAWLAGNPGGAVVVTALLGLLPLLGIGFLPFLPGAVPAFVTLQKDPRSGMLVACGATALLAIVNGLVWRQVPASLLYPVWVLAPPLLLAVLLARSGSLSLCLQIAALAGVAFAVAMHAAFGDPARYWEPVVRKLAEEMERHGMHFDAQTFIDAFSQTLWGWIALITVLLALSAVFVARWWQSLLTEPGRFGAEFRELRLGRVLGVAAAVAVGLAMWLGQPLVGDVARVLVGVLLLVGLAAVHRFRLQRGMSVAWLWVAYAGLVLVGPIMVPLVAGWGFVDNWQRSGPPPAAA